MLTRRTILGGALALTSLQISSAALAFPNVKLRGQPSSSVLDFRLKREGTQVGSHVLRFKPSQNGVTIDIAVDIAVGFGPIVLYRYKLRGQEVWENGQCVAASSQTDNDGSANFMKAEREPAGLRVEGSGVPAYIAPENAVIASHWNEAEMKGPWINLQNGELLRPNVTALGPEPVRLANGKQVAASCYAITGPAKIRIWYTPTSIWTGLTFTAKDGSQVHYERMT